MKIRAFAMLRLVLLFTLSSAVLVYQFYEVIQVFESEMCVFEPTENKYADSLVRCAMFCSFGCRTFNFNHNSGLCLTYNTCHTLNMTVTEMRRQLNNSLSYYSLVEDECKRSSSGYDYTGKVSVTQSGRICQAWNSQTPHSHPRTSLPENYCRNPDGEPAPWCYTTDPNKRFEICNIPYCVTRPLECIRKDDPIGRKYLGTINVTKTGEPCQRWDSQTPHTHRFDELADQENYCRNSIDGTGPWCYTTNADSRWEYCTIPHC